MGCGGTLSALLAAVCEEQGVAGKLEAMQAGVVMNPTEVIMND